jgi:hypothetical protein
MPKARSPSPNPRKQKGRGAQEQKRRGRSSRSPAPAKQTKGAFGLLKGKSVADVAVKGMLLGFFFFGLTYIELVVCSTRANVPDMVDHPFNWALPMNEWLRGQEAAAPGAELLLHKIDRTGYGGRSQVVTILLAMDTALLGAVGTLAIYFVLSARDLTVISAMLLNHSLRACCFLLVELPKPKHIIWRTPGFPADGENDYFFSGHVGLPLIAGMELWELGYRSASLAMHFLNLLQIMFMVTLQLHYTVDLVTGIFSGISCYYLMCGAAGELLKNSLAVFHLLLMSLVGQHNFDFSQKALSAARGPMFPEDVALRYSVGGIIVFGALTNLAGGF